jgi:galactonate dehydratase
MKIDAVETFLVPPRWLFVKVSTDEGIVGWGEPVVEGRAHTVQTMIAEVTPLLLGSDPLRIEDTWQLLWRSGFYRGGAILASAVAGIDQALWDIAGKSYGTPVYNLLGGPVRDRVRSYSWVEGDSLNELNDRILEQIDLGYDAVKLVASGSMTAIANPATTYAVVARAQRARETLGPDRDFAMDFHGRVTPANSKRLLALLEETNPLFIEEPTVPELASAHLRELVAGTTTPLAMGERQFSRWEFRPLLEAGLAVVQPDISHAGGISETRRIAALAEVYGATIAPHCPLGPIALAASMHVDFAAPNFLIQEQSGGMTYNGDWGILDYLVDTSVLTPHNGYLERPMAPGLGIEVDEAAVRTAQEIGHDWHPPIWRHADGSLAEW